MTQHRRQDEAVRICDRSKHLHPPRSQQETFPLHNLEKRKPNIFHNIEDLHLSLIELHKRYIQLYLHSPDDHQQRNDFERYYSD